MKFMTLVMLIGLAACSSAERKNEVPPEKVSNESFRPEKPLSNGQVKDYYTANIKAMSPALQDETIDRYSAEEVSHIQDGGDPLLGMAVKCAQGDFKAAFALASKSFNRYQKVAGYWNLVANCHLNQGNHRKALLFYNKALEVTADYVPALNNIGVLYSRQGQDQKALVAFERANKNSRFSKTPRYNLGNLYLAYGLADMAIPLLQGLLDSSPQDVGLLNGVASAHFLMGNYKEASGYFQRIPAAQLEQPEIGLNYALTLGRLNKRQEALKVLNSVREPQTAELKRYHGVVASQLGGRQ